MILHTPVEKKLQRVFAAMADEEPDLFDAYQNTHPPGPEATLKKRPWVVSFAKAGSSEFLFLGVYLVVGWQEKSLAELDADPHHQALQERYGVPGFAAWGTEKGYLVRTRFQTLRHDSMGDLRGRLRISHKPTQSYVRLADQYDAEVLEISRKPQFVAPAPDWREFILTAAEVRAIPRDWAAQLKGWRGVYLITDESDGARYVGSAYGSDNLLGRWSAHVAGDHGVTKQLGLRKTDLFRFSILQLLTHDAEKTDVIKAEHGWMDRLDTRKFGLNV